MLQLKIIKIAMAVQSSIQNPTLLKFNESTSGDKYLSCFGEVADAVML